MTLQIKELESSEWLRQKYWENELTLDEMALLVGCSKSVISRRMKKYNILRRSRKQASILMQGYAQYRKKDWLWEHYMEKELSSHEIARMVGCTFQTVCRWLAEFDIPRRDKAEHWYCENREHSWNDGFFDRLSPSVAYVVGFLIADGTVRHGTDPDQYVIAFTQKQRNILEIIANHLSVIAGSCFHQTNSGTWQLTLNSKHAYEILTDKFDIPDGREKSYIVRIPDCIFERDDLLPHCIRGIFDGDGSVKKEGTSFSFSSGSPTLLNDIVSALMKSISLPYMQPQWSWGGYIKKDGARSGAYRIHYCNVLDAVDFARFIYGPHLDAYGSNLYLERKRRRLQRVCDKWHGREWLCEQIEKGKTNKDIAVKLGISRHRVTKVLNGIGVYDFPYKNPEWLRNAIEIQDRSIKSISKEFSARNEMVQYYCEKYGVAYTPVKPKLMPKEIDDPEWLERKYWGEGLTMKEIAVLVGVALNTVVNRMNKYNIPRRCTRYNWNLELGI